MGPDHRVWTPLNSHLECGEAVKINEFFARVLPIVVVWWCTRGRVGASGVGRRQWLASGYRQAVSTDLRKLLTNRTKHPTTVASTILSKTVSSAFLLLPWLLKLLAQRLLILQGGDAE
jgi:hypothetical protein